MAGQYHAHRATLAKILGTIAIVAATSNIVGGFPDYRPDVENVQSERAEKKP